jgi:acyl dehydratase
MPLDQDLLGWNLSAKEPYEVGREKVREFAAAVGEAAPIGRDPEAARAAGYADIVAPPTFAILVVFQGLDALVEHARIDYSRVVHADQQFTYARPITAGDRLSTVYTVDRLRSMGDNDIVTLRCEITDASGDPVCTALSTIVVSPTGKG